jgi:hypothetical protein
MAKTIATVFGYIFLLLGILGFFNNPIVGADGVFLTNTAHNIIHLLSGGILLWIVYTSALKSAATLKVFGIVYLIIAILGFLSSSGMILGRIATGTTDNWLDLVLGILFVWAGYAGTIKPISASSSSEHGGI